MSRQHFFVAAAALCALYGAAFAGGGWCVDSGDSLCSGRCERPTEQIVSAAQHGDVRCAAALAYMYEAGVGTEKDYSLAAQWHRKAAEGGDAGSEYRLGRLLQMGGWGLRSNYGEALEWYRRAAAHGVPEAKCSIGYMYENGLGVVRDLDEAIKWYKAAAKENVADAGDSIARLTHSGTIFSTPPPK